MTKRRILSAVGVVATALGLFLLYRVLRRYDFAEVADAVASAPPWSIVSAVGFTIGSFAAMAFMEWLAVRYTRQKVSVRRIVRTTVAALGIGHSIGLVALSSGGVRYRMYRRVGVSPLAVGEIVLFSGLTVGLGLASVGGIALLWRGGDLLAEPLGITPGVLDGLGWTALAGVATYNVVCAVAPRVWRFGSFHFRLPSLGTAIAQTISGAANLACASGTLYCSLRGFVNLDYPTAAALYVGSDVSALVGHVPGGWGLFEYIVTESLDDPKVIAGVVLFRAVYFLMPLAIGLGTFLSDEIGRRRARKRGDKKSKRSVSAQAA
ncbi:MAG: lysylphosphatidylglycerol synthase transmembrane domain-containing protein [Gemmatimonas sp.]